MHQSDGGIQHYISTNYGIFVWVTRTQHTVMFIVCTKQFHYQQRGASDYSRSSKHVIAAFGMFIKNSEEQTQTTLFLPWLIHFCEWCNSSQICTQSLKYANNVDKKRFASTSQLVSNKRCYHLWWGCVKKIIQVLQNTSSQKKWRHAQNRNSGNDSLQKQHLYYSLSHVRYRKYY